jgi:peptide deformylase
MVGNGPIFDAIETTWEAYVAMTPKERHRRGAMRPRCRHTPRPARARARSHGTLNSHSEMTDRQLTQSPLEESPEDPEPDELLSEQADDSQQAATELDPETIARRDEALRHVRKFGDLVLRAKALEVERFDDRLRQEIERMGELMDDALGVGLAATQIGVLHRVLVYRAYTDDPISALVNPVIEWSSEELETATEGCLSLPGVHVEVERPARVRVRGMDARGKSVVVEAEELEARIIQHEIDHLDGILILDRISREARRDAMRALREGRVREESASGSPQAEGSRSAREDADASREHPARDATPA